jgi:hypothetical protein
VHRRYSHLLIQQADEEEMEEFCAKHPEHVA